MVFRALLRPLRKLARPTGNKQQRRTITRYLSSSERMTMAQVLPTRSLAILLSTHIFGLLSNCAAAGYRANLGVGPGADPGFVRW